MIAELAHPSILSGFPFHQDLPDSSYSEGENDYSYEQNQDQDRDCVHQVADLNGTFVIEENCYFWIASLELCHSKSWISEVISLSLSLPPQKLTWLEQSNVSLAQRLDGSGVLSISSHDLVDLGLCGRQDIGENVVIDALGARRVGQRSVVLVESRSDKDAGGKQGLQARKTDSRRIAVGIDQWHNVYDVLKERARSFSGLKQNLEIIFVPHGPNKKEENFFFFKVKQSTSEE